MLRIACDQLTPTLLNVGSKVCVMFLEILIPHHHPTPHPPRRLTQHLLYSVSDLKHTSTCTQFQSRLSLLYNR